MAKTENNPRFTDYIIIIVLIVGLISLYFYMNYEKTKVLDEVDSRDINIESLNVEINELESEINVLIGEKESLTQNLESAESEKENVSEQLVRLKWDIASTINDLEDYKRDVTASMAWFKTNSILYEDINLNWVKKNIGTQCYRVIDGVCRVKSACFYLVNDKMLNLKYRRDIKLTGETDKLQSLEDFYNNRGGDCEDYSLFFKAQHNSVMQKCEEQGIKDIVIEAWVPNPANQDQYIVNFVESKPWYTIKVDMIEIPENYIYPNIVCGNLVDPIINAVAGHCVIAYTKEKIKTIDDVYNYLNKAPMVEPQDGQYLGLINDPSSEIYINSNSDDSRHSMHIWQVITDDDLFRYYRGRDVNWAGYSEFSKTLSERILSLRDFN